MISNTAPVRVNLFKQSMMRKRIRTGKRAFGPLLIAFVVAVKAFGAGLDPSVQQIIVSVAADWDASTGKLQLFDRAGNGWKAAGLPTESGAVK